jgi:hypothetical protein
MSTMLFIVLIILVAYAVTVALALGLLFSIYSFAPRVMGRSGEARPLLLFLNVVIWSVSAAIGGMLVGWIAQSYPILVALGLACVLFAAILSVALESIGKTSLNYEVTVAACAAASVLGGSLLMQLFHLHLHISS